MPEQPQAVGKVLYAEAITPLLDWNVSPASVSEVVRSLARTEAELSEHPAVYNDWYDGYCLLVSDYLCSALPSLPSQLTRQARTAVTAVTKHLLARLGTSQSPALAPAILALAGGHQLPPEVRAEKQRLLSDPALAPPHITTAVASETESSTDGARLPQTDLSAGLLDCLSQESDGADLNIPGLLSSLNTGPVLLSFLLNQSKLSPYISAWREVAGGAELDIPVLSPDCLKSLLDEVSLTSRLLNLPVFRSLSAQHMVQMSALSFSCLLASLACTRLPGDLAMSDLADSLVSHCLEVVRAVTKISKLSSRLGAATGMNLTSSAVWLILSGLRPHLQSPPPRLTPSTASLAEEALIGLQLLTGDLGSDSDTDCPPASLDITGHCSGLARLKLVLGSAPVMQLLLQIASQLHQTAATISSMEFIPETVHETPDVVDTADPGLGVDEDDLVLGLWMMRLLAPVPGFAPAANTAPAVKSDCSPQAVTYLSLSATILSWLSSTISSHQPYLRAYTSTSLSPDLVHSLSFLLQESDCRPVQGLSSWPQFSSALSSLSHQLVSSPLPSPLVSLLLADLSLSPTAPLTAPWPLAGSRRSLSLLAQVLLRRQPSDPAVFGQYVNIWNRAMNSVAAAALAPVHSPGLSRANIHLLLLFFHSLQLMQKKTVLLTVTTKLKEVCEQTKSSPPSHTCLLVGQLAMILDYLVRHLYEPPSSLLPQIKDNLFSLGMAENSAHLPPFLQLSTEEEEDTTYYLLYPAPSYSLHSLEVPKLDGLAVSFLLSTPDVIDFPKFYSSLIEMLEPILLSKAGKAAHYCFLLVLRLLLSLPPPASVLSGMLEMAKSEGSSSLGYGPTLHCLLLSPRAANKAFSNWMKDCLVKQGIPTTEAEALLKSVAADVNSLGFEVTLIREYLSKLESKTVIVSADLLILDCLMGKLQISLDKTFNTSKAACGESVSMSSVASSLPSAVEAAQKLVPCVARLLDRFAEAARDKVIKTFSSGSERDVEPATNMALAHSLSVGGTRCPATASLALPVTAHLPPGLRAALDDWVGASITGYPTAAAWRNQFAGDLIPGESYLATTIAAHAGYLSSSSTSLSSPALKHSLFSAARFACDLIIWCPDSGPLQSQLVSSLFPLLLDSTTENLADLVTLSLERVVGTGETDQFLSHIYSLVVKHGYPILVRQGTTQPQHASDNIPQELLSYLDMMMDKPVGRAALSRYFSSSDPAGPQLTEVLLSITSSLSPEYAQRVLRLFNKLFSLAEKHSEEEAVMILCGQLSGLLEVTRPRLEAWLSYLVVGMFQSGQEEILTENRSLLQSLTGHIVRESSGVAEKVPLTILELLLPLARDLLAPSLASSLAFPDLMAVMSGLASAGAGAGHLILFPAALDWLMIVKQFMTQKNVIEKLENGVTAGRHGTMLDNCSHLLSYINDVTIALKYGMGRWGIPSGVERPSSPSGDGELVEEMSWSDEEDEDSGGEDSDEEQLDGKLCTYTQTARVFMTQHWYHCHTCGMVEGVGCCSVCAKVCHRDCDVTYSKHGSFFCDCGAKEDQSCAALRARVPLGEDQKRKTGSMYETVRQKTVSPRKEDASQSEKIPSHCVELARLIDSHRGELLASLTSSPCVGALLELARSLAPVLECGAQAVAPLCAVSRLRNAISLLHSEYKTSEPNDQLVLPTLGSQEGAFENVKMNFSGEQGQKTRQLLNANMIRRGIMCCLSSPGGKRQHLAVAHEKGKITVLQLSALLKQADSSQKKLTLTRLSSAPIPFTVLSLVSNPCNENFLAVCGLTDCHVLTFNSQGGVSDQLVLQPQLEAGNYIIKAIWLPGSQTLLALVTADSVKIYELLNDALSPSYYFLVPSGKIRDVTFVHTSSGEMSILLMSSAGHIYFQQLCDESSAKHGSFYVTNIMELTHPDIKDTNGSLAGGGVSIYYSHTLQLLFCSYAGGKSFMSPLTSVEELLSTVFPIQLRSNGGSTSKSSSPQVLSGWGEVSGHPGVISCVLQSTGNPVIIMLQPDKIITQEIKVGSKAKIMDMVAIRHTGSANGGEEKTTIILLCEDGSLKIYMAGQEVTGYWLQPSLQPICALAVGKVNKKKRTTKVLRSSGILNFPKDFFEHCQHQSSDIEFGGQDVLQVYNVAQVKQRLQTSGLYIANTKPGGFTLEISNNDNNTVMVGLRVLLGSQDIARVPSSIEVFGRSVSVTVVRPRWVEFCFTREESIQCQNKINLNFGASQDPGDVNMIDSVQVWTKTKEAFGWSDDADDFSTAGVSSSMAQSETDETSSITASLSPVDKVIVTILECLEAALVVVDSSKISQEDSSSALDVGTRLLVAAGPPQTQTAAKTVVSALHQSRTTCNAHTDSALLQHATQILNTPDQLGVEQFHHLVATARNIAVARPGNLVRFAETQQTKVSAKQSRSRSEECQKFIELLSSAFWRLLGEIPQNYSSANLGQGGLTHIEVTVQSLIEILHAFTLIDIDLAGFACEHYLKFLLCPNSKVSFPARAALVKAIRPRPRRRRILPTPPGAVQAARQPTPRGTPEARPAAPPPPQRLSPGPNNARRQQELHEAREALNHGPGGVQLGGVAGNLEALLPMGRGNLPAMLDLPHDMDDELAIAIALSLQDQGDGGVLQQGLQDLHQGLQGLQQLANLGQGLAGILGGREDQDDSDAEDAVEVEEVAAAVDEVGHYSDTTASAPGSDDEGSVSGQGGEAEGAESEGVGGAGSDSGGSLGESIGAEILPVSGRSSAYDVGVVEIAKKEEVEMDLDTDTEVRLSGIRQVLLERLVLHLSRLREVGGARCIPFMQLCLALAADLDPADGRDKAALTAFLTALVTELGVAGGDSENNLAEMANRSEMREFQLVILRLLSVLMSRTRAPSARQPTGGDSSHFVSRTTAAILAESGLVGHHLKMLKSIVTYWQGVPLDEGLVLPGCKLLRPAASNPPPDMAPFFLKQYVKSHAYDVFEAYPQLLTEMALRIPYQLKKISDSANDPQPHFDQAWFNELCELMITPQAPFVKRQVRKLLLLICGSKDQYRQLRDLHTLETRIREIKITVGKGGFDFTDFEGGSVNLLYDTLIQLIEQFKNCVEVAESRTLNWQRFCMNDDTVLTFLLQVSYMLDNGVSPLVLQLLQSALCPPARAEKPARTKSSSPEKTVRKDKSRSEEPDEEVNCGSDESLCIALTQQVSRVLVPRAGETLPVLARFVEKFLLECNTTSVRWQAHALVLSLYNYSAPAEKQTLIGIMWSLWRKLSEHGRRAAQFVDLLGYFSVGECTEGNQDKISDYARAAVSMLRDQNTILSSHSNSAIYTSLAQLVDFTGYYLESDPCLVCNNPEVSFSNLKLSSLKVDTKFTTSTQMVKLSGSHSISKILLRIGDLKRQKMVRTINIYYNNRTVQAVVELKNKPTMWHLAKKITLTSGQTDLKIEFPLPIVACNIMIEYSDFYENIQAVGESLQCPRCSATVPANPGVCSNCGENVFQCHKCRAINYDEKDPFLCNSCGFCKYAKFEYSLTARPCCAVDPIENEEDRKKALSSINSLLEKADKVYRQLIGNKPELEQLLIRVSDGNDLTEESTGGSPVNKYIHQLGQKYCMECKNLFEDLSKLIQKVMATRLELISFDKSRAGGLTEPGATPQLERKLSGVGVGGLRIGSSGVTCYGCATACVEHCLTLLRALATRQVTRPELHNQDLVTELLHSNLRRGAAGTRKSVQALICLLTRNNTAATEKLNTLLYSRLAGALTSGDITLAPIRHDINLLSALVRQKDSCWEIRLRTVVRLFLVSAKQSNSPVVMNSFTLPCLNILQDVLQSGTPPPAPRKKDKEKSSSPADENSKDSEYAVRPTVDIQSWLRDEFSFEEWKQKFECINRKKSIGKYFARWKENIADKKWAQAYGGLDMMRDQSYLKQILFNKSCRSGRQVAANLVQYFIENGPLERRKEMIDSLTSFLVEVGDAGEASEEFMELYHKLICTGDWKYYLAVKGVPQMLASLISKEIFMFSNLEQTRLSSDLALGYAVKQLTSLLSSLLQHDKIKMVFKSRLVSDVLGGYLSLRRLVVQRTKMIDETQTSLLELLEDLTTGTEEETKAFMAVCIQTVGKYPPDDQLTPTFIFERLCSIIFPEESDTGEFFLTLEKDPQQEEFLQGRMLGNPYSSKEPGLGPLMREVKNKICTDCELVALLEDDNGMELLVTNKIISLDLPVKDVYTKIWLAEAGEGEPMRVIYRMRGLSGDATEEFIESLNKKDGEKCDEEITYKLAAVMGGCGGLKVILDKLASIRNLSNKTFLSVMLKLFGYCCKVKVNRDQLMDPSLNVTAILLRTLKLCLAGGDSQQTISLTETVLTLMEKLLVEAAASHQSLEQYQAFAGAASPADIDSLLEHAVHMRPGTDLHHHLMRVLPFLTYANRDNMELIINHFNPVLNFAQFDSGHTGEDEARMEAWVALCVGIERNNLGNTLKDELVRLGIVAICTDYITSNSPPLSTKQILLRTDDPAWKDFATQPSVKFILRGLAGLAADHPATQTWLADTVISQLHLMEQMSNEEHLGSLAEAVLEALRGHPEAGGKVKAVRSATREEKKKMAMAMRAKQLKAIGLKTNDKGQVKAESSVLKQFEAIGEETGLVCVICREGYKFQPGKVLAIYTFTRRAPLEEFERVARKTMGYSTVSHFNLVHVDCHLAAVRQARARDEWESAALQNANTRCNGLLPLWGPGIPESAYAACLARHNTYLAEVTGQRDISYQSTLQDIKLLVSKFAHERSFSVESGGGGPQSNLHLLPYLVHMALYVINTTRAAPRELSSLQAWLSAGPGQWQEQAFAPDGPLYFTTVCLLLMSPAEWKEKRGAILQRLLATVHIRASNPVKKEVLEYSQYRSLVLFWAMVDLLMREMWAGVTAQSEQEWSSALAEWIRNNDETILNRSSKILSMFQEDLVVAQDLSEVMDVCEMLGEIPSPESAILEVVAKLP